MRNTHTELMNRWPSAYALSKATGIPYTTVKRWRRRECIADPSCWFTVCHAAGVEPILTIYALATDYGAN